jgi:hypothetical protein
MKKAILVFLLLITGGLSLGVFAQSGVIKEYRGTVELKPAGTADFVPATVGAQIMQDTIISTGFKSSALLEVGSALITVRPLTRLTLTEIAASHGTETLNLNLQTGRLHIDVNPPAGAKASFTVISPSAVASVRGTSFFIDTKNVRVSEGTVSFKGNSGYAVQVPAGSFSEVGTYSAVSVAQNETSAAITLQGPVGYDAATSGTTGSTGASSMSNTGVFGVEIDF